MIRIDRGPEPTDLRRVRFQRLSHALLVRAANGGVLPSFHDFSGYKCVRKQLYQAQHMKCAFCERQMGEMEQPTEHFRPKDGAQRLRGATSTDGPGKWDTDCYWWLAWTWENLFFACKTCNGASHKGNFFPISGPALAPLDYDLSKEQQGIVHPAREDPLDHLDWTPLLPSNPWCQWEWTPKAVGLKGGDTIEAFHLLKRDIAVQVTRVLQHELVPEAMEVNGLLLSNQAKQAQARWDALILRTLYPAAQFTGAKWCAIRYLRSRGDLLLSMLPQPPRPGSHGPTAVVPIGLPAAPAGVPQDAWHRLLAGQEIEEALAAILSLRPQTVAGLWSLLRGSPENRFRPTKSKLKATLDAMRASGCLVQNGHEYSKK